MQLLRDLGKASIGDQSRQTCMFLKRKILHSQKSQEVSQILCLLINADAYFPSQWVDKNASNFQCLLFSDQGAQACFYAQYHDHGQETFVRKNYQSILATSCLCTCERISKGRFCVCPQFSTVRVWKKVVPNVHCIYCK